MIWSNSEIQQGLSLYRLLNLTPANISKALGKFITREIFTASLSNLGAYIKVWLIYAGLDGLIIQMLPIFAQKAYNTEIPVRWPQ